MADPMTPPTGGEPVDAITGIIPAADLGLGGLLALTVLAIMSGLLLPRWTVTRLLASRDERIQELREMHAADQAVIARQADQIDALMETGRTSARALESIREQAGPGEGA